MDPIHADVPDLASTTAGWFSASPTQPDIHPVCAPAADPLTAALSAAVADWPVVHEALTANRSAAAAALACANDGTAVILTSTDEANATQISGIEV